MKRRSWQNLRKSAGRHDHFNIEVEESRRTYHITERKRVHWYNCGRYGAVSFAVHRDSLLASGSTFSLLFGGGAKYSNGEDSLFLAEFLRKGYKVYTAPVTIGREEAGDSTWFHGYNEKFSMTVVYCIIICMEGWQDRWHCGFVCP